MATVVDEYAAFIFDMDETLAKYDSLELFKLVWRPILEFLVRDRGYPDALLAVDLDLSFVQKGLIFDFRTGDVLKLSESGVVCQASHGYVGDARGWGGGGGQTEAQLSAKYGPDRKWMQFEDLKAQRRGDYLLFNAVFDIPVAFCCARIVDELDATGHARNQPYTFRPDLQDALEYVYNAAHFADGRSPFFEALKREPLKYLRTRPRVKDWLLLQRRNGRRLAVVTNSDVDFANFVMHVSFGADWRKLFDFVGFFARKGRGFFEADAKDSPFLTLPHFPDPGDLPLGSAVNSRGLPLNVRGPPAPAVARYGCYAEGHCLLLGDDVLGCAPDRCVYFGDHITSDIVATRTRSQWHAFALVEEMLPQFSGVAACAGGGEAPVVGTAWGSFWLGGGQGGAEARSWLGSRALDYAVGTAADLSDLIGAD